MKEKIKVLLAEDELTLAMIIKDTLEEDDFILTIACFREGNLFREKNSMNNAAIIAQTMNNAGFDVLPMEMDLSSRSSILSLIDEAQKHGEISMLVNVAGVSVFHRARIRVGDFGGNAFGSSEKGRLILYFYVCSSSLPYDSVKSRTCFEVNPESWI